ncbi:MAG: hypothetical protein ACMUIE_00940 [Thermoplasmatota archaeon]
MVDSTFERLIAAEKEAKATIENAKKQAEMVIRKVGEDIRSERKMAMDDFSRKRERILGEEERRAREEAERIKRDGIEIAKGLSDRTSTKLPVAVNELMAHLLNH